VDVAHDWLETNRANWDARAAVHATSGFYDLAGFRAGADTLRPFEVIELSDVAGQTLLHLQCHMGQDTLSWARRGAEVTGLDFSFAAIATARQLARDLGLDDRARFLTSDVYTAAEALNGKQFDIVYTGLGALVWLPDLDRWAEVIASCLRSGGRLYLVEFHPLTHTLDDDGRTLAHDYFDTTAEVSDYPLTYTDGPPLTHTTSVQWQHTLADVITAVAQVGLRVQFLHEHPTTLFTRYPTLECGPHGEYRFPDGHPRIPLMYSLQAVKDPS
jgi:ubiquinone/menaquinone biosynthesis C-methylase UbiE